MFLFLLIYLVCELYVFFTIRKFGIRLKINYIKPDKNTLKLNVCIKQDARRKRIKINNIQCFYVHSMPGGGLKIPFEIKYKQPIELNKSFDLFITIPDNRSYINLDSYLSATLNIKKIMEIKIYFPGFLGEEPIFYKIFPC